LSEFVKGLTNSQHMYISKERNKLEDRLLHVNRSTFHWVCLLIPDHDGVYKQRWWINAPLLDTHTLLPRGITSSVLPGYFFQLWLRSSLPRSCIFSPAVDARWEHAAKTRFCCNLIGSLVSGGTVLYMFVQFVFAGVECKYPKQVNWLTRILTSCVLLFTHHTLPSLFPVFMLFGTLQTFVCETIVWCLFELPVY